MIISARTLRCPRDDSVSMSPKVSMNGSVSVSSKVSMNDSVSMSTKVSTR